VDDPDPNAVPDVSSPTIGRRLVTRVSDVLGRCGERLQLGRLGVLMVMAAIGAVAFAGLVLSSVSEDVVTGDGIEVRDPSYLQLFTDHRSGVLVSAARALTDLGSVGVLVLVALAAGVVLWFRGVRIIAAAAPLAALLIRGGPISPSLHETAGRIYAGGAVRAIVPPGPEGGALVRASGVPTVGRGEEHRATHRAPRSVGCRRPGSTRQVCGRRR
jgi:hypothetical protein